MAFRTAHAHNRYDLGGIADGMREPRRHLGHADRCRAERHQCHTKQDKEPAHPYMLGRGRAPIEEATRRHARSVGIG
ncbi:hypothetical protein MMOR_00050 [Mycolicibacterium moriokaense]|uniref:Uncharacterized protein n=1 Tax=Mycolicibacterium moriokaense TaxID=39691 RepID=A0AAD1H610_9MYCO|nr:hypothetical protein MMOR_00050 [Mycolicibacterium moriokaense]